MRLHIVSDGHADIEYNDWTPPALDPDVVVICAGDMLAPATLALPWMRKHYPDSRIIYVPGNHDYYSFWNRKKPDAGTKTSWEEQKERAPIIASMLGIHFLDDAEVAIDGVRILGGTLWTDFSCRPPYLDFRSAARTAERSMNDYKAIKTGRGRSRDRINVGRTIDAHRATVNFLERKLCETFDGDTIVVTHHPATPNSLLDWNPERPTAFRDLDFCYASATLDRLFSGEGLGGSFVPPSIWVHGHVHKSRDYVIENTRVIANPRGYPLLRAPKAPRENPDFDPRFVIELEPRPTPGFRF
ncbi:metallophosphoesterase [Bradyrhizobium manausense]|uniref:Calcineurin-like phosphoesterase domain-containing protein n=1 Tax=Bradyrhizobium manausense TaxID=989370 RepID=A0A0R3DS16_9BRAD|nr:metallophosphoesterase [Bradyrhizobium manausense]KRQ10165.1 hypothetical protein AOQ71_19540 [Bradyrhizobium manausense]